MKGTEIITRERLQSLGACGEGMKLFDKIHPDGQGVYQTLLDEACAADHPDYASWLLAKIGPTEDTLELEEVNNKELSIVFAGHIHIKKSAILKHLIAGDGIKAGGDIKAVWVITAGNGITAGRGIKAGLDIKAGGDIKAGLGIKAGGDIKAVWVITAGNGITAGRGIKAGLGIEAGWGIKAGRGIKAGWGIKAGGDIKAGDDYGIFAGLQVKITDRQNRTVRAKTKPDNLMCGEFVYVNDDETSDTP